MKNKSIDSRINAIQQSLDNAYARACACEENAKALHADYQQFNNEKQ